LSSRKATVEVVDRGELIMIGVLSICCGWRGR